jgi:hypothetical protein
MAITGTVHIVGSCSGIVAEASIQETAGSCITIDESIPANQTDLLLSCSFDKDRLKMVYLVATEAMTIETNATDATGGDTITLNADEPLFWHNGMAEATNPFATADVTVFYVTNTTAGDLKGFILHDPTA